MELMSLKPLSNEFMESIGFSWHTDPNNTSYVANEAVVVSEREAEAFYDAANELYDMFVEAGQYVIDNDLFFELGIPFNLVESIKESWENEVHWHIYGRFDFAGGLDGKPIKLLEFNADTPTMVFESAIIQWALLKFNGLEGEQFNNLYEALSDNFKRMITLGDDPERFSEIYEGWKILFSSIQGSDEEESTMRLLERIAREAGFETAFCYVHEAKLDATHGLFFNEQNFEFWFKLIPWENIAIDEPELARLMEDMIKNKNTIFLNPAYTLLFQSKRMLKILWDLFPNHPLLLEASNEPLVSKKQVKKHAFGREGESVQILGVDGEILNEKSGVYGTFPAIYQEYAEQNSYGGESYQPNVFYAYEACALGFRKGGEIIDNYAKFVSHIVR
ncbi:MAG: glutathionylspermidine synthase family protein [Wolinella sp.]